SDLRQLRRLGPLLRPLNPGTDVKAVIDELYASAVSELDYRGEADSQRVFAGAFRVDPRIHVPGVLASSPRALVTEWAEGRTLGRSPPRARARNATAPGCCCPSSSSPPPRASA